MTWRYGHVALLAFGLLMGSVERSWAADLPVKQLPHHFLLTGSGWGALAAESIIGVAAVLCLYDLILKIEGFKNWDGTPKAVHHPHHHH
jgi:hypothetical protein